MAGYTPNTKAQLKCQYLRSRDRLFMSKKIRISLFFAIAALAIALSLGAYRSRTSSGANSPEVTAEHHSAKGEQAASATIASSGVPANSTGIQDALNHDPTRNQGNAHPKVRDFLFAAGSLNVELVNRLSNDRTFELLYTDLARSADAEHLALGRNYSSQLSQALAEAGHGQRLERFACASQVCLGEVRSASEDTSGLLVELAALSESGRMPIGVMSFASAGFDRPNAGRIRVVLSPTLKSMTARPATK